jgi:hypothetical protein
VRSVAVVRPLCWLASYLKSSVFFWTQVYFRRTFYKFLLLSVSCNLFNFAGLDVANIPSGRFGCEDICLLESDAVWEAAASPETSVAAYHTTRHNPNSVHNFDSRLPDLPVRVTGRSLTYTAGNEKFKLKHLHCTVAKYIQGDRKFAQRESKKLNLKNIPIYMKFLFYNSNCTWS